MLAIVMLLVGLAQTPGGHHLTTALGLSAPAEPFTELYFTRPSAPAAESGSSNARATVSFVIHNKGHVEMRYTWTISAGASREPATGTVRLDAGQRTTVRRQVASGCRSARSAGRQAHTKPVRVRVSLKSPMESIDYWQTCDA